MKYSYRDHKDFVLKFYPDAYWDGIGIKSDRPRGLYLSYSAIDNTYFESEIAQFSAWYLAKKFIDHLVMNKLEA